MRLLVLFQTIGLLSAVLCLSYTFAEEHAPGSLATDPQGNLHLTPGSPTASCICNGADLIVQSENVDNELDLLMGDILSTLVLAEVRDDCCPCGGLVMNE
jgi:hypothetical protein